MVLNVKSTFVSNSRALHTIIKKKDILLEVGKLLENINLEGEIKRRGE